MKHFAITPRLLCQLLNCSQCQDRHILAGAANLVVLGLCTLLFLLLHRPRRRLPPHRLLWFQQLLINSPACRCGVGTDKEGGRRKTTLEELRKGEEDRDWVVTWWWVRWEEEEKGGVWSSGGKPDELHPLRGSKKTKRSYGMRKTKRRRVWWSTLLSIFCSLNNTGCRVVDFSQKNYINTM